MRKSTTIFNLFAFVKTIINNTVSKCKLITCKYIYINNSCSRQATRKVKRCAKVGLAESRS